MAFSVARLSVLAYANGFTLWHYKAAPGGVPAAAEGGYFNIAGDMLNSGDMILVSACDGGRLLCVLATPAGISTLPLHT